MPGTSRSATRSDVSSKSSDAASSALVVAEQADVLARPHPVGEVVDRVDGELHRAVRGEDRLGAHDRPPLLAGRAQAVAERPLRRPARAARAAREARRRRAAAVARRGSRSGRGRPRSARRGTPRPREADEPRRCVVRVDDRAGRVLGGDPVGDGVQDREQLCGRAADIVLDQPPAAAWRCWSCRSDTPESLPRPDCRERLAGRSRKPPSARPEAATLSRRGPLAQLVEQGTLNPKVEGSIPSRPT